MAFSFPFQQSAPNPFQPQPQPQTPQQPQFQFQPQQPQFQTPQQPQQPYSLLPQPLQPQQQQQLQQQGQQPTFLFKADRTPASYNTKWEELHPDSQKILLQIEEKILEYRNESQMLDQCSRLYDSSVANNGFELDANRIIQAAARGRTPDPSASVRGVSQTPGSEDAAGATPREDIIPPADDDYNPTFDGTPSPDVAGLSLSPPPKQGYVPTEVAVGEGVEHPVAAVPVVGETPSLQAIHDLLVSGPVTKLPNFSDFAPSILEGGGWRQALHSAMAVTFTTTLPTASPPEEGKVTQGTTGEGDDGAELVAERIEISPPAAILPSTPVEAGAENVSRSVVAALLLPEASGPLPGGSSDALAVEGLRAVAEEAVGEVPAAGGDEGVSFPPKVQAVGGGSFPPSSGEVSFEAWFGVPDRIGPIRANRCGSGEEPGTFPEHEILWPDVPQEGQLRGADGMLDFFVASARGFMGESNPPSVEAVRRVLRRSTLAYHLMGCPRDPWMAAVDSLWSEVRQLHQEAVTNRLRL
ncbi:hypothetical protein Taro_018158 [Colocasia esculenta]|uniref:Uncharacterized protein n=1 Tax=Colocasia esculenta TaxID=4460 RepID=A0A843UI24_COLES|nr:hypothetical protein [Colocasia esculenta]